ncbi:hypothetical protein BJX76DRAFT_325312 [Aspergillus varians]
MLAGILEYFAKSRALRNRLCLLRILISGTLAGTFREIGSVGLFPVRVFSDRVHQVLDDERCVFDLHLTVVHPWRLYNYLAYSAQSAHESPVMIAPARSLGFALPWHPLLLSLPLPFI